MSKVIFEIDLNEGSDTTRALPIDGVVHRLAQCAQVFSQLSAAGLGRIPLSEAVALMGREVGSGSFVFAENAIGETDPILSRVLFSTEDFVTERLIPPENTTNVPDDETMIKTLDNMRKEHEREASN